MQGTGGAEQQTLPASGLHLTQQIAGEDCGGTAAAGAAAVDILLFRVEDHHTAVIVVGTQVHAVPGEQVDQQFLAQNTQIPGDDQVVIVRTVACVPEVGRQSVIGGGGRSQGCTMWKMFSVKFNAYSSPEARRF